MDEAALRGAQGQGGNVAHPLTVADVLLDCKPRKTTIRTSVTGSAWMSAEQDPGSFKRGDFK